MKRILVLAVASIFSLILLSAPSAQAAAVDPTVDTIRRVNTLAEAIGNFSNALQLTPQTERAAFYDSQIGSIQNLIESLKADIAKNNLTGTVYENIVVAQSPAALDEIRDLVVAR